MKIAAASGAPVTAAKGIINSTWPGPLGTPIVESMPSIGNLWRAIALTASVQMLSSSHWYSPY
ncbi:MAG: hypothetical protein JOZ39_03915 [Chloroflexi bacterium]|nr:hypothetical protein [Chloroflexota bacterium]